MPEPCPTPERLATALREGLSPAENAALAAHLSECPGCQAQIQTLAGSSSWLDAEARRTPSAGAPDSPLLEAAIRKLESRPVDASSGQTAPLRPRLDFIQPSAQPGVLGQFGAYEVLEHVASGGMGIVLKARDPVLNRVVALKILPPALAANELARARFVREARAAAAVVHEHVVPIFAVDETAGLPYIVMQFIHGRPLSERIRATGPLRLEEVLRIGAQTAAGLTAAHAQGLIHRDVKPGNILLENSVERVKLTDFGLARAVDDAGLTRTGELAGTPEFMSPEQANNDPVDHRADLFSFGSVLYAMCTGCSPFQADSVPAVLRKVCDAQPPPVHEVNPVIPRWLSDIVARLMAKSPAERFQSAEELGELLERYLGRVQRGELGELPESAAARAKATTWVWQPQLALGVLAAALVVLSLFAIKHWPFGTAAPEPLAGPVVFVVRDPAGNTLGSYADAKEALRASPPSGVLELNWNGAHEIPPLDLGRKPLTLRAGTGFHPVWSYGGLEAAAIRTEAVLNLENLEFEFISPWPSSPGERRSEATRNRRGLLRPDLEMARDVSAGGPIFVSTSNTALHVSHCFFRCQGPPPPQFSFIVLHNSRECVVKDSAFNAIIGRCVTWRHDSAAGMQPNTVAGQGRSLVLSNTALFGHSDLWLDLEDSSRPRLEMTRCTFRGREAISLAPGFSLTNLSVKARRNVVDTSLLLFDDRARPPRLSAWLRWTGLENLFHIAHQFVGTTEFKSDIPTLAAWNDQWPKPSTATNAQVTFAAEQAHPRLGRTKPPGLRIFQIKGVTVGNVALAPEQWATLGADTRTLGPQP